MTTPKTPPEAKYPPVPDEEDLSIEYPSGDGEPMADNDWQWIAMADTAFTLRNRYAGRTDVYVTSDMLVYYRMNDVSARVAPDVYLVFGASGNHRRDVLADVAGRQGPRIRAGGGVAANLGT